MSAPWVPSTSAKATLCGFMLVAWTLAGPNAPLPFPRSTDTEWSPDTELNVTRSRNPSPFRSRVCPPLLQWVVAKPTGWARVPSPWPLKKSAWDQPVGFATTDRCSGVQTTDLNGDGFLDLVTFNSVSGDHSVSVLLGNGNGAFGPAS